MAHPGSCPVEAPQKVVIIRPDPVPKVIGLSSAQGGAVETAILNNINNLTIGKSPINSGSVTITAGGANNENTGTIVVESGSLLQCAI